MKTTRIFLMIFLLTGIQVYCDDIKKISIFFVDPWSSAAVALSSEDVVKQALRGAGSLNVNIEGELLKFVVSDLGVPAIDLEKVAASDAITDLRIVFRFYNATGNFVQLSLADAKSGFWDRRVPPPTEAQIVKFLRLVPPPLFEYTINPAKLLGLDDGKSTTPASQ